MSSQAFRNRRPAGSPASTGGQFATTSRAESAEDLPDPSIQQPTSASRLGGPTNDYPVDYAIAGSDGAVIAEIQHRHIQDSVDSIDQPGTRAGGRVGDDLMEEPARQQVAAAGSDDPSTQDGVARQAVEEGRLSPRRAERRSGDSGTRPPGLGDPQGSKVMTTRETATLSSRAVSLSDALRIAGRMDAGPGDGFRETGPEQRDEIVRQVGTGNLMAISGGRVYPMADGVELPVSNGYSVRIRLAAEDTYTVSRVLRRGDREFIKGVRDRVYADEVGNAAYLASCFRSYDANEWPAR